MTNPAHRLVGLPSGVLRTLRQSLERVLGDQAAPLLQEAGFATGDEVYAAFADWADTELGLSNPETLEADRLGDTMSRFFDSAGWGPLSIDRMGTAALCLTAPSWAEAAADEDTDIPSCHLTTGMLAAFLGRLANDVVAVMEVECRSRGDTHCRFLIGAPDTLQVVFDGLSQGSDYEAVLTTT